MTDIFNTIDLEQTLEQIFLESHSFMAVLSVPDFRYLKSNTEHQRLLRKSNFIGKTLIEVEPELEAQGILDLLNEVVRTGKPYQGVEVPIHYAAVGGEPAKTAYLDFRYQPIKGPDGKVYVIACQGYDVTEKILARKELELRRNAIANERENFGNLFKQIPEMVCILDGPEHRFEFVNESHIRALGFDATGKTVREAQPESTEIYDILDQVYQTGVTAELREIPVTLGDQLRYFNLTYSARRDDQGVINGIMILGSEVTDVVRSRQALARESRLIESMPAPFFAMDKDWKVIYWNPASVELIGLKPTEVLGRVLWDVFPGLEDSEFGANYKKAYAEQKILNFDAHYPHFNKWYRVWPFPFEGGIAVTFLDVTDRKVIEEKLEKSEERYRMLFDNSPLPKWIIDVETMKFVDVNQAAIVHYGYSKEEFLSMSATEIRPPEDVADFLKTMEMDFIPENFGKIDRRRRHRKKDGSIIEVEISALDLTLDGRKSRIGAIVDMTDRVQAEARQKELLKSLHAAKEEAERANQLKSAFLANMSHEIRTPLGAMLGFSDLLKDPALSNNERANYVDILTRNGEQLSYIINDILDLSKVEAGHLTFEFNDVTSNKICSEVVSLLSVKAKEKNLALEFIQDPSTPKTIVSDSTRIRQILLNLVGNAIKFTQFGSVKLRSYGCQNEDGLDSVCFDIVDTGIGIPADQQPRLFEMFVQADGSMTRKFGGTGLGLALSRRLARELGGDVTIEKSIEGKGSTFKVIIKDQPQRRNAEEIPPQVPDYLQLAEQSLEGVKVLVIDDSPDNQMLIWHFLTNRGAIVESAENGFLGYRKALAGKYDIVLMDIQMPEMDGYTATQKLRSAGYQKPIIALTAHAMSEVRMKCLNVGCTDHLPKPINSKELIGAVAKYTSSAEKR